MNNLILILQIVIASILVIAILAQVRGTGFGRVWGGGSSFTRRGLEKLVFRLTFIFAFLFIVVSALALFT